MLSTIGVEVADEEDVAILTQHQRRIEAGATGYRPGVGGGALTTLSHQEARCQGLSEGCPEGICISHGNQIAVGIRDRDHVIAGSIKAEIQFDKGIGIGVAAAAGKENIEDFTIV